MLEIARKRRQISFRIDEELTMKLETLEKALPGQVISPLLMCKDVALSAISKGIDNLYKIHNIPVPEFPKTPEEKMLVIMDKAYKNAGMPLPKMSEEEHVVLLEELRKTISST